MTSFKLRRNFAVTLLLSGSAYANANQAQAQTDTNAYTDEIIVTGSPLSRSIDEAITGVSILSGDELSDRLASTIGETLKSEPGISSTFFGAGASRPILRGQGGIRVRVLTNGIGSIDASAASPDHAVSVEPAQAERIEVLRGAGLLRYGSSGSGGVVNVIDGRIPNKLPEDGLDGAIRVGASSVDDGYEGAGSLDVAVSDQIVLHLGGTFKNADDYSIPGFAESAALRAEEDAEHEDDHHDDDHEEDEHDHEEEEEARDILPNSASKSTSLTGGLSFIGNWGHFGVAVHDFNADYGVPGGHHHEEEGQHDDDHDEHDHEEGEEEDVTIGLDQTRIDVNGVFNLSGNFEGLHVFGGYADYKHTEFEGDEIGTVFTNEGYEVRVEAIQRQRGKWKAAYGAQLRERDFEAVGDEAFVPPTKTRQIGLYTFHQSELNDLHLEAGGRYENTRQSSPTGNSARSFDLFSLSAGGDYHVSDAVRIGGTVFRTERAPSTEELFSNGPHLATEQFELGDPTLGKEVATGIEAAIRHREDTHFVTANIFYTNYDNFIFETETGGEEDGLPIFQFTGEDASFRGFEIQAGADIGSVGAFTLQTDALVEYVRAKTDTGNLPRIPPLSILTGVEADSDSLNLRAEVDYTARQSKTAVLERESGDYALVNAFVTWTVPTQDNVKISFAAMNIFDIEARQHTSFLKDVAPLPGRNFRVSVRTQF